MNVPGGVSLYVDDVRLVYATSTARRVAPDAGAPPYVRLLEVVGSSPTLTVSPNPNPGRFGVVYTLPRERDDLTVEVFDDSGRRVLRAAPSGRAGVNRLALSTWATLPAGMYVVRLLSADGTVALQRRMSVVPE